MHRIIMRLLAVGSVTAWNVAHLSGCTGQGPTDTDSDTSDLDTSDPNPLGWPECVAAPPGPNEGPPCDYPDFSEACYLATTPAWDQGDICMVAAYDQGSLLTDENVERYMARITSRPMLVLPCCETRAVVWARQGSPDEYGATIYDAETRHELAHVSFPYAEDYNPELGEPPCLATYAGDPALMPCIFNALHEVSSRDEVCEDQGCECVVNGFTDAVPGDCE